MTTEAPYVAGSATSEAAAASVVKALGRLELRVLTKIQDQGLFGATDDELEQLTGLSHQTASARRRTLVLRGQIKDSGVTRTTRSGRQAVVWVIGTQQEVVEGAGMPVKPARPAQATIALAVDDLREFVRIGMKRGRPLSPELAQVGQWLAALAQE